LNLNLNLNLNMNLDDQIVLKAINFQITSVRVEEHGNEDLHDKHYKINWKDDGDTEKEKDIHEG